VSSVVASLSAWDRHSPALSAGSALVTGMEAARLSKDRGMSHVVLCLRVTSWTATSWKCGSQSEPLSESRAGFSLFRWASVLSVLGAGLPEGVSWP
jgi:hypothetical protein